MIAQDSTRGEVYFKAVCCARPIDSHWIDLDQKLELYDACLLLVVCVRVKWCVVVTGVINPHECMFLWPLVMFSGGLNGELLVLAIHICFFCVCCDQCWAWSSWTTFSLLPVAADFMIAAAAFKQRLINCLVYVDKFNWIWILNSSTIWSRGAFNEGVVVEIFRKLWLPSWQ